MPHKFEAYRNEILTAIRDIESFVSWMSFESYMNDEKTKAAVERKLLVIGEALSQMNRENPNVETRVLDLKKIVAFRNILVHSYFGVDDRIVWNIVISKLHQLRTEIEKL